MTFYTDGAGPSGGPAGAAGSVRRGSKYDRKIGHWRVDYEGHVTYKKVCVNYCHQSVLVHLMP